ncbi:hypothetical protein [Mycobacterium phage SWU1]|uniref:DUF6378 domain-containing protein n=1 Tax=Mycobacterium phage SWU1 TaxID=1175504 RepID=I1V1I7_9CAUD|nr:phosphofructokinase [Mycobacterium phage SWU1]AFI24965.1 hypothetical protein [Mycobacterium phage SWU1]
MSILTTAEEIINGQRAQDYGDAKENHERIATLWGAYKRGVEFTPEDVAVMMILLKIARFMENGYHQDTVVDIAGYAGVLEKMQLPEDERYPKGPRQWDTLLDVPADVKVVTNEFGVRWTYNPYEAHLEKVGKRRWSYGNASSYAERIQGPFTEVIE